MLPEGGRDHLAHLFYYPIFAEGERRASLGNLGMDAAAAGQDKQHAAMRGQSQYHSPVVSKQRLDRLFNHKLAALTTG